MKPGDSIGAGRRYIGRVTKANVMAAIQPTLRSGVKLVDVKIKGPWLYAKVRLGKKISAIAYQNVGGLIYLPGNDRYALEAWNLPADESR